MPSNQDIWTLKGMIDAIEQKMSLRISELENEVERLRGHADVQSIQKSKKDRRPKVPADAEPPKALGGL